MTIGALITNYESWDFTIVSAHSLLKHCHNNIVRILIIDDCSSTPIPNDTSLSHPLVAISINEKNIGYVASINKGFKMLNDCDVVIVLDCDSHLTSNPITNIVERFGRREKLGAIALCEEMPNGEKRISGEAAPTLTDFVLGQRLATLIPHRFHIARNFVAHSCSMVVRRTAFESVNGFDESFDFLDADIDFSLRLIAAGWTIDPAPEIHTFHRGSGSPQSPRRRVARFHRNRLKLLKIHGQIDNAFAVKCLLFIRHSIEILTLSLLWIIAPSKRDRVGNTLDGRLDLIRSVWTDYKF